jgi:hypothetical protein
LRRDFGRGFFMQMRSIQMTNLQNDFDGLASARINPLLEELDQRIRKSVSAEKLGEELLEQRAWFLDRLGKNSRQFGSREQASIHARVKTLHAVGVSSLPHCAWNFNKLTLDTLSTFVGRNNGELQIHLWNEGDQLDAMCLRFSNVAEVDMVIALLIAAMEFKSDQANDAAVEKDRQTEAFNILKCAGGLITIASLVEMATYLGLRLRIAVARN